MRTRTFGGAPGGLLTFSDGPKDEASEDQACDCFW